MKENFPNMVKEIGFQKSPGSSGELSAGRWRGGGNRGKGTGNKKHKW